MAPHLIIFNIVLIASPLYSSHSSVQQGSIAITTIFRKYRHLLTQALSLKIPLTEIIYKRISIQNCSVETEFQVTTINQDKVYLKTILLHALINQNKEINKNA